MKIYLLLAAFGFMLAQISAQTTALSVYQIMQGNCTTSGCHTNAAQAGSLDLEGTGGSESARMNSVYSQIYFGTPTNTFAAGIGNSLVYPGRIDKSFLFRKINEGLEPTQTLATEEIPEHGDAGLTDVEKEMIRQWIIWGAPLNETVVDETIIDKYYNTGGMESFPDGPPNAPDPAEGIQIKLGPFFVKDEQSANVEIYQKYELDFDTNVEVTRIETFMSNFSHHLILFDYNSSSQAASQSHGLRFNPDHINVGVVKAIQEPTDLKLPQGAAFFWDSDQVLDLNSHYINYIGNVPYKAEVYLNIYYEEPGSASQEMFGDVIPNLAICVPPNGDEITFQHILNPPIGNVFIWGMMGHTHQLGTGYKIWKRENFAKGELVYDGACPFGAPGCPSPYFDYQHIPMRYYSPFMPVNINFANGLIHEASYVNNGNQTVCWGPTSEDEMMVMVIMYMTDTTGVITSTEDLAGPLAYANVYPNPMHAQVIFDIPLEAGKTELRIFDLLGREVKKRSIFGGQPFQMPRSGLLPGAYIYSLENAHGNKYSGKLLVH